MGNSQLKWSSYDGNDFSHLTRCSYKQSYSFEECFREVPTSPDEIYFISVTSVALNRALEKTCLSLWGLKPKRFVTGLECNGVTNGYAQPDNLGVDRWAAMNGAYHFHKTAVAVFDCGTATTFDVVDSHGTHHGGAIIPGLDMMRQSLVCGTTQITAFESDRLDDALGRTTAECIDFGTLEATAGFVDRMVSYAEQVISEPVKAVITGGSGRALAAIVSSDASYTENLVFWGMLEMVKSYRDGEAS